MPGERVREALRRQVVERARGCCEYCQSQAHYATQRFSVERILPRRRGGSARFENLAPACQGCNNPKYGKVAAPDPVSGERVPLYHPRRDHWESHFAWSDDFTLLIGLTPTGRATVEALQLNREGVVNLRRILYGLGAHPPP